MKRVNIFIIVLLLGVAFATGVFGMKILLDDASNETYEDAVASKAELSLMRIAQDQIEEARDTNGSLASYCNNRFKEIESLDPKTDTELFLVSIEIASSDTTCIWDHDSLTAVLQRLDRQIVLNDPMSSVTSDECAVPNFMAIRPLLLWSIDVMIDPVLALAEYEETKLQSRLAIERWQIGWDPCFQATTPEEQKEILEVKNRLPFSVNEIEDIINN